MRVKCKYLIEVLYVKSLSPYVKDDVFEFLHLIYVMWVMCDAKRN